MDRATEAAESIRPGVPAVDRQLAIERLTGLGRAVLPVVTELTASENPLRRAAGLEVMGNWGMKADAFVPFFEDPSYVVRKIALEGIRNAEVGPDNPEILVPLLDDAFWPVRCAAVRALAAWPFTGLAAPLLGALKDPDSRVRYAVLQCMDLLSEEIPAQRFEEAADGLSLREYRLFMEACVPLVRAANLTFFERRAEQAGDVRIRTAARFIFVAQARKVPKAWISELLDLAIEGDKEVSDAAGTLIVFAGDAVAETVRARLETEEKTRACDLAMVYARLQRNGAVPFLADWIFDEHLSMPVRLACLDGLLSIDSEEAARAFARLAPDLAEAFRQRVMDQSTTLANGRYASYFEPFFLSVIESDKDDLSRRAFLALCQYDDPPTERLLAVFRGEENADRRRAFAPNLVKPARGERRDEVIACLLNELESDGPAAPEAAQVLPSIAGPDHRTELLGPFRRLLTSCKDPGERRRLLFGLLKLDPAAADRDLAKQLKRTFDKGNVQEAEYLVSHLDSFAGEATAEILHGMFAKAEQSLREEILRTLVRRSDPAAVPWIREVFASASISYKRSVMVDLASAPKLASACEDYLRRILYREMDADLLASAIQAAPDALLKAEEERLLALAAMGQELGMESVDALFNALAGLGTDRSRSFLLDLAGTFIETAIRERSPHVFDSAEAGPAETALLSLARVKDGQAIPLLARMLFLHAHVMRRTHILELWSSTYMGVPSGASHKEARAVLDALLQYGDAEAEPVVLRELDAWAKDGRLFECGDAAFCAIFRELWLDPWKKGRFPRLAERLEALTLACAPAQSPADFRVYRLRAIEADRRGETACASDAYKKACHVLKFYPPARKVLRDVCENPDRFEGNDLFSVMMSDRFLCEAAWSEKRGERDKARRAALMAQRYRPFR